MLITGEESAQVQALLSRLKGRPVLVCGSEADYLKEHQHLADFTFLNRKIAEVFTIPEGKVTSLHTDLWMHRDSPARQQARTWLTQAIKSHPRQ